MSTEYDTPTAKELCARISRFQSKVETLQETVDFLEAEVLALGNILIKKNILSLKEIEQLTSAIIHQKIAEKSSHSSNASESLRQEFEDALQEKIKQ